MVYQILFKWYIHIYIYIYNLSCRNYNPIYTVKGNAHMNEWSQRNADFEMFAQLGSVRTCQVWFLKNVWDHCSLFHIATAMGLWTIDVGWRGPDLDRKIRGHQFNGFQWKIILKWMIWGYPNLGNHRIRHIRNLFEYFVWMISSGQYTFYAVCVFRCFFLAIMSALEMCQENIFSAKKMGEQ